MKEILKSISALMIEFNEFSLPDAMIQNRWFGNKPATLNEIKKTEERLQASLPDDYKEFLMICNGFHAFNRVEPTFHSADRIKYLWEFDPKLIQIWEATGNIEIALILKESIIIAGIEEEQSFLLIPPDFGNKKWRYWKFAAWIPGEEPYNDLNKYFNGVLHFMQSQTQDK